CPQPLTPLLTGYAGEAGVAAGRVLVEALTRRHYRIRGLEDVHELVLEGVQFVLASYERGGRRHHVAAAFTEPAGVAAALRAPAAREATPCRAVARASARAERLIAVAEVRDLTAVRDEAGRITALPELERMARQALEEMRAVQSRRPSRERLQWNRLLLYAWPA